MEAQFQTDINRAISEVRKIKDANFLEEVIKFLKNRPSAEPSSESWKKKRLTEAALVSREDIKAGRIYSTEEAEHYLDERMNSWK